MEYGDVEIDRDHCDHHDIDMEMDKEYYDRPVIPEMIGKSEQLL